MSATIPALLRLAGKFEIHAGIADAEQFARDNLVRLLEHTPSKTPIDVSIGLQGFEREAAEAALRVEFAGVRIRVPTLTALLVHKMLAANSPGSPVEDAFRSRAQLLARG